MADELRLQGYPTWILELGWRLDEHFVVDEQKAPHSPVAVEEQDSVVAVRPEPAQPDLMADTLDWDTSSAARAEHFLLGRNDLKLGVDTPRLDSLRGTRRRHFEPCRKRSDIAVDLPAGDNSLGLDNSEQTAVNIHPFVEDSGRPEDPHSGSEAWVQQTAVAGCFRR